ncbi:MAG: BatA domain-containing protein, partial [Planctomycetota bacterium]
MGFVHPFIFAAGAAAIALPILIHLLFRRRRRPIRFAAMRFLEQAIRKQRRRLQLEQWILLLLRCLVILLIALGLARPLFGDGPLGGRPKDVLLLVDDAIVSGVLSGVVADGNATEFEDSVAFAAEAISTLDQLRGDRVTIVTLASPAERRTPSPALEPADASRRLAAIEPTAAAPDWPGATRLIGEWLGAVEDSRSAVVVIASSLRGGSELVAESLPDLAGASEAPRDVAVVARLPAEAPAATVAITAVTPTREVAVDDDFRGPAGQVRVTLTRSGSLREAVTDVRLDAVTRSSRNLLAEARTRWEQGELSKIVALTPSSTPSS